MAQYEMSIRYAGEALEDGRMPIKDLAPALLAISGALQEIQRIKDPNQPTLAVDIKATKKGSFIVDLILANGPDVFSRAVDLLTSRDTEAFLNLVGYGSLFFGMFKLIKSKTKKEEKLESGQTKITLDNGETVIMGDSDLQVYRSVEFRTQIRQAVTPLEKEGIDSIEFSSEKIEKLKITKSDVKSFDVPNIKDEEMPSSTSIIYVQLLNVAFEHGKWRFFDGSSKFFATIEDEGFMEAVTKGTQQFSTNDRLKVKLRTEQKMTARGLESEFYIEEVLEHIPGAVQLELDFGDKK
ncbi:hypothetical protein AAAQ13_01945 [Lactococcus lactis subsp. lactis]|mgnify:CR=1 FL=1|uniref:hypothetical protein n=1 Tax=Lactococcus lactis TaxID=1358 RepID=UPI00071E686A|nr:hypothetical protein [Lactococcus lactis]MDT3325145.1 hypothetical protein [Bacillota bacterium]KST78414.1 hypothetical protein LK231_1562 [Lactococcus lactis subsp. lactis]MBR8679167.1 hypothetical protein [Lactococcus lactis subsp. lactis]MBR8681527.1 hypothetical protein [Lactococcus lactis subsp. lactis]MBR8686651.1 hypothetical protein [Lactococcus lactis subsp. lactis]